MIQVKCHMYDCSHYHKDEKSATLCQCSHPDKKYYLDANPCPLYRMDWSKQAERVASIQSRFKGTR